MQLYRQLEKICKLRISSNSEIFSYIKRYAQYGKLDAPKQIDLLAFALDRIGKLEDRLDVAEAVVINNGSVQPSKDIDLSNVLVEGRKLEDIPEKEILESVADRIVAQTAYDNFKQLNQVGHEQKVADVAELGIHIATVGNETHPPLESTPQDPTTGTFPCPDCKTIAQNKAGLSAHKRAKHPEPKV